MHVTPPDVIVVGGGRTGRFAALELQARGCTPHVIDAAAQLVPPAAPRRDTPQPAASPPPIDEHEAHALQQWRAYARPLLDEAESLGMTSRTQPLQDRSFIDWLASCLLPRRVAEQLVTAMERAAGARSDEVSALFGLACVREVLTASAPTRPAEIDALATDAHSRLPSTLGARVLRIVRARGNDGRPACTVEMLVEDGLRRLDAPYVIVAVPPRALRGVELIPSLTPRQWAGIFSLRASADGGTSAVWPVGRSPFDEMATALREESLGLFLAGGYVHGGRPHAAEISGRAVAARVAARIAAPRLRPPGSKEPAPESEAARTALDPLPRTEHISETDSTGGTQP